MKIEKFINCCRPKKMDKDEMIDLLLEAQEDLIEYFVKFAHNPKHADRTAAVYERLGSKTTVKAIKEIEKHDKLEKGFVLVASNYINYATTKEEYDVDIVDKYTKLIKKVLKDDTKEISEKTGIDEDIVTELLVVIPDEKYRNNEKYVRIFMQKVLRKIYMLSKTREDIITNPKQIKKFFKLTFGKDVLDLIAIYVLLERKEVMEKFNASQVAVFNKITVFALEYIESREKKKIKKMLKEYIRIRMNDDKRGKDAARRFNFAGITDDTYGEIYKVVEKLKADEDLAKYL